MKINICLLPNIQILGEEKHILFEIFEVLGNQSIYGETVHKKKQNLQRFCHRYLKELRRDSFVNWLNRICFKNSSTYFSRSTQNVWQLCYHLFVNIHSTAESNIFFNCPLGNIKLYSVVVVFKFR